MREYPQLYVIKCDGQEVARGESPSLQAARDTFEEVKRAASEYTRRANWELATVGKF